VGVRRYEDLQAWQLATAVKERVIRRTLEPAWQDHRWLRDQLRKAASSGCVNIAEGFSRYQPKDFARFLVIAKSSLSEVIEHLADAQRMGLLDPLEVQEMQSLARRARGATTRLIHYLRTASPPG
jgi:four helix bundle protein